ncbi:hypothetical protein J2W25_001907 [Variovorax boronicumulans]|uniref:DUF4124 domain-containing protein n=1 Tax=Variovorax boronicumulans TaxID=436515 RepID=A0AAW8DTH2_9BURK|nr:DUF4124 domain-containing protein [Variovorax boronicumulans]MDP9877601.1 hypothetical protein [Variovorax boronicumulans]MDP9922886.1 hypothetical protein [Variovorax boronicumulans]
MRIAQALILAAAFGLIQPAIAQKPVYKCIDAGKTTYSNEPCINAVEIDATPTRGMDKWTGTTRKGKEVNNQEHREAMSDALRPLLGMNREQYATAVRRQPLALKDRAECTHLDGVLDVGRLQKNRTAEEEVKLYKARKRFNDLQC